MSDPIIEDFRRLMLAAAGAAGLAADEAKKLLDRMVARGEVAEKDARAVLKKIADSKPVQSAKTAVTGAAKSAGGAASRGWEAVLSKLNVPSRADMQALEKKIDKLNARIRRLTKEKG